MKTEQIQSKTNYTLLNELFEKQGPILIIAILLFFGMESAHAQSEFSPTKFNEACGRLLQMIEGPFGALITTAAGIGAIIASAVGGFRTAWALIVVSVGAFILRAYITLFFAPCFTTG
jgi:hypothetical protein